MDYSTIKTIQYHSSSEEIEKMTYLAMTKNTYIADKQKLNKLIQEMLPDIYQKLNLHEDDNPYRYRRNDQYFILNIKGIDHFFTFTI